MIGIEISVLLFFLIVVTSLSVDIFQKWCQVLENNFLFKFGDVFKFYSTLFDCHYINSK